MKLQFKALGIQLIIECIHENPILTKAYSVFRGSTNYMVMYGPTPTIPPDILHRGGGDACILSGNHTTIILRGVCYGSYNSKRKLALKIVVGAFFAGHIARIWIFVY